MAELVQKYINSAIMNVHRGGIKKKKFNLAIMNFQNSINTGYPSKIGQVIK
jgi:hypothetical protein